MIVSPDHHLIEPDGSYVWTPERVSAAWATVVATVRSLLPDPRFRGLVLLAGLPGAGKTTWLAANGEDDILYVDATFTRRAHREPFLRIGADAGKPTSAVLLDTPLDECLRRNATRSPDRKVPEDKVMRFHEEIASEPPSEDEGFASVTIVIP